MAKAMTDVLVAAYPDIDAAMRDFDDRAEVRGGEINQQFLCRFASGAKVGQRGSAM
jgi:hypothetical protein